MINSQNNERLFFADKVVLVEGITDRLILTALLEAAAIRFRNSVAVEVIEVGGKGNFTDYQNILRGLLTPAYVVADLDYLAEVGSQATKGLFVTNSERQFEVLTQDKKSVDRVSMIERLEDAIEDGGLGELRLFWNYFRGRLQRLKEPLTKEEREEIEGDLLLLRAENVFVLRHGEIEDYLPTGVREIKTIVETLVDRNWINRVADGDRRVELGAIVCAILDVPDGERDTFIEELRTATVAFPAPALDSALSESPQSGAV
jgi:hypothetical protein